MEASFAVSAAPNQQWSGSTGDSAFGRYRNLTLSTILQAVAQEVSLGNTLKPKLTVTTLPAVYE